VQSLPSNFKQISHSNPKQISKLKVAVTNPNKTSQQTSDPYMGYNFAVEIGGIISGGFTEVSGLSSEIQLESYEEGGLNSFIHQFPKKTTYPNLVLTRGLVDFDLFFRWYKVGSEGSITPLNGIIQLLNNEQNPVLVWAFKKAYPVKWEGPSFKADSDEILVERIELVHQGISKMSIQL